MSKLVRFHRTSVRKRHATKGANVRLLTRMNTKMFLQRGPLRKRFVALWTTKGSIAGVNLLMVQHVAFMGEALVAVGAGERLFAGVTSHVCRKIGPKGKRSAALCTCVRFLAGMSFEMLSPHQLTPEIHLAV